MCRTEDEWDDIAGGVAAVFLTGQCGCSDHGDEAAHRLADRFSDGCLFLDLHGHTPRIDPVESDTALERLLNCAVDCPWRFGFLQLGYAHAPGGPLPTWPTG